MKRTETNKNMSVWHRLLSFCILCLFTLCAFSQEAEDTNEESVSKVILLHTDKLSFDQYRHPGAQILTGNVQFQHEGVFMYCDSACFYQATNSFDAFGNVKMVQGDTLDLVGDMLFYNGMDQLARVRHNVILTHRESRLYTDSLDYDRMFDLGYFFEGGKLVDKENELTSDWGQYSPTTRQAVFNYNVKLNNPGFTLISDTLNYNTQTSVAEIVGPSNIDSGDNHIYSESGFYNTQTEQAILLDRSILTNNGRKMIGDSVFYDSKAGVGKAFRNIIYTDELNKNMFTGHYCLYNEKTGYSEAADSAVAIDYSQKDSMYLHADSFKVPRRYRRGCSRRSDPTRRAARAGSRHACGFRQVAVRQAWARSCRRRAPYRWRLPARKVRYARQTLPPRRGWCIRRLPRDRLLCLRPLPALPPREYRGTRQP